MKHLIFALALLFCASAAHAATPVPPCAPPLPYTYQSTTAGRLTIDDHQVDYYFCPGKFEWSYHGIVYKNGAALTHMPTSLAAGWKAVTSDWDEPQWKPVMDRARMSILPHIESMPVPAYVVAPASSGTQKTYAFTPGATALNATNGTRATKASGTVAVGSACNCASRVAGSTIYCAVPSAASGIHVAACVRKP